ncbi:MAG TPA: efflux RND transporter permease subunit [Steroidobacteraceae bacterium]|nr:efflux RND transporter permease subunit [Steroidobacteraceae bacterium]
MSISEPFVRRPIATSLLMGGILLVGLVAFPLLPVAPLPQVDFPTLQVNANLPGASPETMASAVAQPLEYQFSEIPGLAQMTSTSVLGSTSIALQFNLDRNIDGAAQDVQQAIAAAAGQLPKDLPSPPTYRKVNPADSPIIILAVHSDVLPLTTVDNYAENVLAQQVSQIPGVAQVNVAGQQKPAVRVQIDPAKIAALGIQLTDVANVISTATVDAPKGSINGTAHNYTIYDNDQLLNAAPWNNIIVAYHNGAPVRIKDIGRAVDGPQNTQEIGWQWVRGWPQSKPGILLIIFKQPGVNVIDTVNRVKALLPRAMLSIPKSIQVDQIGDRTITIRASLHDVEVTLLITVCLVIMVIFVFLRNAWATIIPGVTVPLALLGTCALMYALHFSLDNLSLMALTIAVGFVVDDAIVMLENIYRHIEEGLSPLQATLKGAREIGFTILSISISLVAVFIPLLLMGGIVGRLFREFAITVTMTIAVSAFVALTLSPTMAAQFVRNEKNARHGAFYRAVERGLKALIDGYTRGLDFVLRHQRPVLYVFFATMVLTVVLYVLIPKGFFPQEDTSQIVGQSDAPQDISFPEMVRREHLLTDVFQHEPDMAGYVTFVGGGRPLNNDMVFSALLPRDQRKDGANADQIIARMRRQIAKVPGATMFLQSRQDINVGGRLSRTEYQYTLQDISLDELNAWAPRLLARMQMLPQLRDVASDQQNDSTMLTMQIDRDAAARFGIQPAQIDATLADAFGQADITQYFTQLNSYFVVLEITPALQADPNTLQKIYLKSPATGAMVPLSTFVHYDTQHVTFLSINHQGQFPAVTLSFNLAPGAALGDAVKAIQRAAAGLGMPATITGSFQGTAQAFQTSLRSEPYLILAAVVVVYIILGMLYESYIHPLTILSTLPSAGVGALLVLMLFHYDLSVLGIVGILLLIGIVKKNGIMMVDFAINAEREQGMAPEAAIRQACLLRFRPIMMTTMAALLGSLPLALGHGTGSELRQPLGVTMAGGLILSQAMTLFTTPVVYLYLDRLQNRGRRHGRAGRVLTPEEAVAAALAAAGGVPPVGAAAHAPGAALRDEARRRGIEGAEPEGA